MWSSTIPSSTSILALTLLLSTPASAYPVATKAARFDLLADIGSLFNTTTISNLLGPLGNALSAFLGDAGNPAVQNDLVTQGVLSGITSAAGNTTTTSKAAVTCPAMSVIFARGTGELGALPLFLPLRRSWWMLCCRKWNQNKMLISFPTGNVGLLTGPPFFAALGAYMNNTLAPTDLSIQGVPYTASISSFLQGGSKTGAMNLAAMINTTLAACPNTQLSVSGYSQGAQVVHMAMASLPAATTAMVSSVVLFGDPLNGTAVAGVAANRQMVVCHAGDDICAGGDQIKGAHLSYAKDAPMAAMFALSGVAMLGISSASMQTVMANSIS